MEWLVFRLLKFLGLALFAAGLGGSVLATRQRDRLFAAHNVATPGLFLTWMGGYGLLKSTGVSMGEPWVGAAILTSLTALHGATLAARLPSPRPVTGALAAAGFTAATALMVLRAAGTNGLLASLALGLIAGAASAWALRGRASEPAPADEVAARTLRWFTTIARLEGASLLFMLFVSMPLRRLGGIAIDGGQGWVGWVHGVLTLIYLQALLDAARTHGWGAGWIVRGFFASVVPFGTFWFERWVGRGGNGAVR